MIASHGIVATSQPLAAQVGLEVLKAGGTAADAAIATDAMMGLVEPMSCGIGGDLFVIYWDTKTQKLYGLNASGRSPYAVNRDVFKAKRTQIHSGRRRFVVVGPRLRRWLGAVAVAIRHDETLAAAEPRDSICRRGFSGQRDHRRLLEDGRTHRAALYPDTAATYYPNGRAPRTGEMFRNPNLAASLRTDRRGRPRRLLSRPDRPSRSSRSAKPHGGYFSMKDFEDHTSDWVEPVSTNYRGYDVWELPPNGQGIAALEILNILEGYDIRSMGRHSPDYLHLFIEAKKLAYADRAKFYRRPGFRQAPRRRADLEGVRQPGSASGSTCSTRPTSVDPGDPLLAKGGDTIYLCVVDKDRNCCSFIQSNFAGFGSRVVPGKVGFVMQNRGSQFSLDPKHLNSLEPHKRPFHTIIPAMVTKDGKPWLCFGVMGGDMQPQGHVQVLVNMIDFGLNVQAAGDAGRVRHDGSQTPTGQPMDPAVDSSTVESSIPPGHNRRTRHAAATTSTTKAATASAAIKAIWIDQEHGTIQGAPSRGRTERPSATDGY